MREQINTVIIGLALIAFGVACGYAAHHEKYQPSKVYEDGSYVGCMKGGLCND